LIRDCDPDRRLLRERNVTFALLAECLRAESKARHASIERTLLPLLSPGLTLERYRTILEALLGFYEPLEGGLIRAARLPCDLDVRGLEKARRLRRDLRALGASEAELVGLPACSALPRIDGARRALGCMYVLEGSMLGGRIIARNVQQYLSIDADHGGAFFHGYGGDTAAVWKRFLMGLNRQPPPFDDVLAATLETFDSLEHWLLSQGAAKWQ
jgi:heme oxygenase